MKLTKAQRELLELACTETTTAYSGYAPAVKLRELGLVTFREGRYGGTYIEPTDAGRAALAAKEEK